MTGRCEVRCPKCNRQCVGIAEHLEETKDVADLHGDGLHSWHHGSSEVRETLCVLCQGVMSANPYRPLTGDGMVLRCGEHQSLICPWCLCCQSLEPTPATVAYAVEKRGFAEQLEADALKLFDGLPN